jgi:hypothetical protein
MMLQIPESTRSICTAIISRLLHVLLKRLEFLMLRTLVKLITLLFQCEEIHLFSTQMVILSFASRLITQAYGYSIASK